MKRMMGTIIRLQEKTQVQITKKIPEILQTTTIRQTAARMETAGRTLREPEVQQAAARQDRVHPVERAAQLHSRVRPQPLLLTALQIQNQVSTVQM